VQRVDVRMDRSVGVKLLFDPGHNLDERILREQFVTEPDRTPQPF
jgi:NAD+ kinase